MGVLALTGGQPVMSSQFPWPIWGDAERKALAEVLDSGHWGCLTGPNPKVKSFEASYASYHDAKHCICTTSGTTALQTAMLAWGIRPGDEVILPAYTFVATASAVLNIGAVPVFADIKADTYDIDPKAVEAAITDRTRAIIAVHIGGSPADLCNLAPIANERGLLLLEDAAQAAGAIYKGRKVGAIGHMGCFSFQASKNLNCGEGGAILTDDDVLAAKCRSIINCGRPEPPFSGHVPGTNYRMTEFQAALLLCQLEPFEEQAARRDANYRMLERELGQIDGIMPARMEKGTDRRGCHLFMFGYDASMFGGLDRETFVSALNAEGVPCCCGYQPLYRNELFTIECSQYPELYKGYSRGRAYRSLHLPATEDVCAKSVWIFQQVLLGSTEEMEAIVKAVKKVKEHQAELATGGVAQVRPQMPSI